MNPRIFLSSILFALCLCQASALPSVVINEIHYNPDVKTESAEFIELYNRSGASVDLSGWSFTSGVKYQFPSGTSIAAGGYVVIAGNPAFVKTKFGVTALGPFSGGLSKYGDKITLTRADGGTENQVEYQDHFPWPIVGDPPGYSIELIHPDLDNTLGASWRASSGGVVSTGGTLVQSQSVWKFFKGKSEASTPTTAWRQLAFDDSSWSSGPTPVGYDPAVALGTVISDMNGYYTSIFFRKTIVIDDPSTINALTAVALYDDGFKMWINGVNVLNENIATGEVPYNGLASVTRESNSYDTFNISGASGILVRGTNIIAVQLQNILLTNSSDCFFDLKLSATSGGSGPSPGKRNSVYATNAPPQIRQVDNQPEQPPAGVPVTVTAKITDPDGVANVSLQYQIVEPGNFIELTDAAYATNWITLAMNDSGTAGDVAAGDSIYTAVIPASVQTHRRLIRYRVIAKDSTGLSVQVPYADDPQPNFAYFVYNGVPAWTGAVRPGTTAPFTVSSNEMNRLPVYTLLAKNASVLTATGWNPGVANNQYGGDDYLWHGAMVYDGKVYDHIGFRSRGGVWRYAMGKNALKFAFNRGHDLQARDNWGNKYDAVWRRLSFRPNIQQGDYLHRGEQGLFESVGYKLFELAGVHAPKTVQIQFRVIDGAQETLSNDQYNGDFYGCYLVVEEQDGRFLEERGMPDGNIYDMESGSGTLNHTGSLGPVDKSDLNAFLGTYSGADAVSDAYWRTNLNLPIYYSYQAIIQGMHQYDIADGKNYFYYLDPQTKLWEPWPWDLDLSWADNMYRAGQTGGDEPFKSRVLNNFSSSPSHPALSLEFRNRVREIRDLLFNSDQAAAVIDEYYNMTRGGEAASIVDVDRAQWDYNPIMSNSAIVQLNKAGNYHFYEFQNEPTVSKSFAGAAQLMKNYIIYRCSNTVFSLDTISADSALPATPTVTFTGGTNFALNKLSFHSTDFSGASGFSSIQWRMGEVTDTNSPVYDPTQPHVYEITPVWQSGDIRTASRDMLIPASAVQPGHKYRVRSRMLDAAGKSGHWSAPVEFVAAAQDNATALVQQLKVTELMYNSPAGSDYDYIELFNNGSTTLDLAGAKFTSGIDYTFAAGVSLAPSAYMVVTRSTNINNFESFRLYYSIPTTALVVGPYNGNFDNSGESVVLKTSSGGQTIFSFTYGNGREWPAAADGAGHSLVPLASALSGESSGSLNYSGNWRASTYMRGSAGRLDPDAPNGVMLNEIAANTEVTSPLDSNDWIELFNKSQTNLSFGANWYLSDSASDLKKWMIPATNIIAAHGFVSFDEVSGFHTGTNSGFGLSKSGEAVYLSYLPGTEEDRIVDAIVFEAQENGSSLGRYPDGKYWTALQPPTRGSANANPPDHPVFRQVMYHPPDIGGTNDDSVNEFIEIYNPLATSIVLSNTNGQWRLSGDIGFDFPTNKALAAHTSLLVANLSPTNSSLLGAFRAKYNVPATLEVLGPYSGKLANDSGRVSLEKPQAPDVASNAVAWVVIDEVVFADQNPWPVSADGGGASLQKISLNLPGNDPANWMAATPNFSVVVVNLDSDGDGIPDAWEMAHGLDPHNPADALLDPDKDGFSNLKEYLAGTDPQDPNSYFRIDSVSKVGGQIAIRFQAQSGNSYALQSRPGVASGTWSTIQTVSSTNGVVELRVNPGAATSLFRLVTPAQ